MAERKGVMIYFEVCKSIDKLNDDQAGRLFKAIMLYASTGALPDFGNDVALDVSWGFMQDKIDRDAERYAEKCEKNKENQQKRWVNELIKAMEAGDTTVYERIATAIANPATAANPTIAAIANQLQINQNSNPNAKTKSAENGGAGGENPAIRTREEVLEMLKNGSQKTEKGQKRPLFDR